MRVSIIILLIIFSSCQSPKKKHDFTFYKLNIRESFYLKFNSSDTLYYINTYPNEEQTSFTILSNEEKEKIENILDTLSFPMDEEFKINSIEDGETNAFKLNYNKESKKVIIHGRKGLDQFWTFGKSLNRIKDLHKFTQTDKKIDLTEDEKMFSVPPPPIINQLKLER
jgi:hypothetical protein